MWTPDQYAEYAWSLIPDYGEATSVRDALNNRRGTCLHRSRVVGKKSLELGQDSFWRVYFMCGKAVNFGNYILNRGCFMYDFVSTSHTPPLAYIKPSAIELATGQVTLSIAGEGLVEEISDNIHPLSIDMIAIPEPLVDKFKHCENPEDYLAAAINL